MISLGRLKSIVLKARTAQTARKLPNPKRGHASTCFHHSSSTILSGSQISSAIPATRGITWPSGIGMLLHRKLLMLTVSHVGAQRFALAACCHADQPPKRGMFFERKKALKRNVATRQPARDVRRGF